MCKWHLSKDELPELVWELVDENGECCGHFSDTVIGRAEDGLFEIVQYEDSSDFIGWRSYSHFVLKNWKEDEEVDIVAWCEIPEIPDDILREWGE